MNVFKKKSFQYGTAAAILVSVVLALVVIFNVLIYMFSNHFGWYADISTSGLFRFSDESLALLDTVDGENNKLTVYYMTDKNTMESSEYGKYILGLTNELSNRYSFVSVEFIDDVNKDLLKVAGIYGEKYLSDFNKMYESGAFTLGTMVIRNDTYEIGEDGKYIIGITGEKQADYRVTTFTVNDMYSETTSSFLGDFLLTGRIIGLCRNMPAAYFLTGHGSLSIDDDGDFGNAEVLADIFRNCGYTVEKLNLSEKDFAKDHADGSVAIVFSPRVDLTAGEIERLEAFVDRGGNVMAFCDGDYYRLDKLTAFLAGYGISIVNAKVQSGADASLGDNGFSFAAALNPSASAVSKLRDRESKMAMNSCRLLRIDPQKGAEALLLPPASFTAVGAQPELLGNEAVLARSSAEGRGTVLVSGAASFASSLMYTPAYNNRNLLLSALSDMGAEDLPLNVDVKTLASDGLDLTKGQATLVSITVSVLPALIVAAIGTCVYIRRKRS